MKTEPIILTPKPKLLGMKLELTYEEMDELRNILIFYGRRVSHPYSLARELRLEIERIAKESTKENKSCCQQY